jgi:hypothetical protein
VSLLYKIKNYFTYKEVFTWKYIDLDNELVDEIKDIYLKNLKKDLADYAFFQILPIKIPNIKGIEVLYAGLVYSAANAIPKYSHKDPKDHPGSTLALNIPLINCDNSLTTLYNNLKSPIYTLYNNRISEIAKRSDCKVITSYTLNRPIIFNNQVLHAVDNFSPEPRLAISLRFDKNITSDTFN